MKEPMNKDEDRMVLCMNIFDQITYEKQFAEAIKKTKPINQIKETDI